jgi:hypothetical protein
VNQVTIAREYSNCAHIHFTVRSGTFPRHRRSISGRNPLMNEFAEAHLLFLVGAFAVLTVVAAVSSSLELFPRRRLGA